MADEVRGRNGSWRGPHHPAGVEKEGGRPLADLHKEAAVNATFTVIEILKRFGFSRRRHRTNLTEQRPSVTSGPSVFHPCPRPRACASSVHTCPGIAAVQQRCPAKPSKLIPSTAHRSVSRTKRMGRVWNSGERMSLPAADVSHVRPAKTPCGTIIARMFRGCFVLSRRVPTGPDARKPLIRRYPDMARRTRGESHSGGHRFDPVQLHQNRHFSDRIAVAS